MPQPPNYADALPADVTDQIAVRVEEHAPEPIDAPDDAPPAETFTLGQAIRRAVLHDPRLQAALAHVRSAQADALQARLLTNPILTVSVRMREAASASPIIDAAIAQDIVSLLTQPRKVSAADNRLRGAMADVLATLADVIADTQEAYVTLQALTDQLAALEERHALAKRLVDLGEARLKAGEAARLDVIALQTQLLTLNVDLAERRQDMTDARLTLARLIGEPSKSGDWRLSAWQSLEPTRATEQAWLVHALTNRPEVRTKTWELAALGDEVALSRLALLEGTEVGAQSEYDQGWSVGPELAVPLPLFDWGQAKRAKASAELDAARHQMTLLQRQVVQDVRTQYSAYNATLRTLTMARDELLPLQERRAGQAETSYKAGETDVANLLLAEEDLLDARVKVVDLRKKAALARVKLARAAGGVGVMTRVEQEANKP
jgi:outer membrane protein TolC